MTNNVMRERVMLELEEKAKRKALAKFIQKYQEKERAKKDDNKSRTSSDSIKTSAAEMLEHVNVGRKERFQDDKLTTLRMNEMRRGERFLPEPEKILQLQDLMYPVEEETLATLYQGISHNEEGRHRYLKLRNLLDNWLKYRDSQTLNMDYGWMVEQRKLPTNKQFAKKELVRRTFYWRSGVKGETQRNREPLLETKPVPPIL